MSRDEGVLVEYDDDWSSLSNGESTASNNLQVSDLVVVSKNFVVTPIILKNILSVSLNET